MSKFHDDIEQKANSILSRFGIKSPAVSVGDIARRSGLELIPYEFGENISGALFMENQKATIGFNPNDPVVRQRFTIAHELGHFFMHKKDDSTIYFDKPQILFRDESNSTGLKKEREANAFAACILMPEHMVLRSFEIIRAKNSQLIDEEIIKTLAREYKVSQMAMSYRLSNLGYMCY